MRPLSRSIVFGLGLLTAAGSVAHATDFCFDHGTTNPASIAAAVKFHKPGKGSCSPITGFDVDTFSTGLQLVTGTACLNSSGDTMRVSYVVGLLVNQFMGTPREELQVSLVLPYPSLTNGLGADSDSSGVDESTSAHANPCGSIPIP
jgi:hypothetical protein